MERYAIMVQKRQGVDLEAVKEMLCAEERAVRECCRIFRASGMQKVILVDEHFNVVFKDSRRCKCPNVQEEMYPTPDELYLEGTLPIAFIFDWGETTAFGLLTTGNRYSVSPSTRSA